MKFTDDKSFHDYLRKEGTAYLKYDYEECVFKVVVENNHLKEAWVKFIGKDPFKLKLDSELLAEALLEMNVISEKEYETF